VYAHTRLKFSLRTPPDTHYRYPNPLRSGPPGVVLHQPLKRRILRKNGHFWQNMNGVPVCLFEKTENAPTQGPPKPYFWVPVRGWFCRYFITHTEVVSNTWHPRLHVYTTCTALVLLLTPVPNPIDILSMGRGPWSLYTIPHPRLYSI